MYSHPAAPTTSVCATPITGRRAQHANGERADGTGTAHPRGACQSLLDLPDPRQTVSGGEAPQTRIQQPGEIDEALTPARRPVEETGEYDTKASHTLFHAQTTLRRGPAGTPLRHSTGHYAVMTDGIHRPSGRGGTDVSLDWRPGGRHHRADRWYGFICAAAFGLAYPSHWIRVPPGHPRWRTTVRACDDALHRHEVGDELRAGVGSPARPLRAHASHSTGFATVVSGTRCGSGTGPPPPVPADATAGRERAHLSVLWPSCLALLGIRDHQTAPV